jgi:sodium transport system ATP-binding protein
VIEVEVVSKYFGELQALRQVSLHLKRGEITGLLGLNGAGKSTLMRLMYGLLNPTSGRILVDGLDVQQNPNAVRRLMGVLPDDAGLYKRLTARENITYFGQLQGMDELELVRQTEHLIELLGMEAIADRRAGGFSLGERMKTALARAIVHQPPCVLLDEPTNGLDVITTRAVRNLLLTLRDQGRCVLFSSHLMHEVNYLCDRVVIIAHGGIVADGTLEQVTARAGAGNLEDAFVALSQGEGAAHV